MIYIVSLFGLPVVLGIIAGVAAGNYWTSPSTETFPEQAAHTLPSVLRPVPAIFVWAIGIGMLLGGAWLLSGWDMTNAFIEGGPSGVAVFFVLIALFIGTFGAIVGALLGIIFLIVGRVTHRVIWE